MRNERGTDQQSLINLKKWFNRLKVNLRAPKGFAIKLISHKRGSGILPRGTWTRDYTHDNKLALPPWSPYVTLVRLVALGIDCECLTWSLCSLASRQLSTYGPSSRLYSQRLCSKAWFRFASLAFSLTRRPTL
jgi:hypothetical protein